MRSPFIAGAIAFLLSMLLVAVGARFHRLWQTASLVTVADFGFFHWTFIRSTSSRIAAASSPLAGTLFWVFVVGFFLGAAFAYGQRRLVRQLLLAFSVGLAAAAGLQLSNRVLTVRPAGLRLSSPVTSSLRTSPAPDVYFVMLDGYGRGDVLGDLYDFDNTSFTRQVEALGLHVVEGATGGYSMTHLSLPSMLAMDYVLDGHATVGPREALALHRVGSGSNPVVRSFKNAGYRYIHIEGGWSGSRCGREVDECIRAPLLDETLWEFLHASPLGSPMDKQFGDWLTISGSSRLAELERVGRRAAQSQSPQFVFAHVLLPHPPLFVDRNCSRRIRAGLQGSVVAGPIDPESVRSARRAAYVEQVQCVNAKLLSFLRHIDRNSLIVLAADHGPDSLGQLLLPLHAWTEAQIRERLGTFTAIRVPAGCPNARPRALASVNLFRVVLSCLLSADLELLPTRSFLASPDTDLPRKLLEVRVE